MIIDKINGQEALRIVKILAKDKDLAKKIEKLAKKLAIEELKKVDVDEIAFDIYFSLDSLQAEDVWHNSGSTPDGYIDPYEYAMEIFDEELEPYLNDLKKYEELSMNNEAKKCLMGILKGLYKFEKESTSNYKDEVVDVPKETFEYILNEWKKRCKNKDDIKEVELFVKKFEW